MLSIRAHGELKDESLQLQRSMFFTAPYIRAFWISYGESNDEVLQLQQSMLFAASYIRAFWIAYDEVLKLQPCWARMERIGSAIDEQVQTHHLFDGLIPKYFLSKTYTQDTKISTVVKHFLYNCTNYDPKVGENLSKRIIRTWTPDSFTMGDARFKRDKIEWSYGIYPTAFSHRWKVKFIWNIQARYPQISAICQGYTLYMVAVDSYQHPTRIGFDEDWIEFFGVRKHLGISNWETTIKQNPLYEQWKNPDVDAEAVEWFFAQHRNHTHESNNYDFRVRPYSEMQACEFQVVPHLGNRGWIYEIFDAKTKQLKFISTPYIKVIHCDNDHFLVDSSHGCYENEIPDLIETIFENRYGSVGAVKWEYGICDEVHLIGDFYGETKNIIHFPGEEWSWKTPKCCTTVYSGSKSMISTISNNKTSFSIMNMVNKTVELNMDINEKGEVTTAKATPTYVTPTGDLISWKIGVTKDEAAICLIKLNIPIGKTHSAPALVSQSRLGMFSDPLPHSKFRSSQAVVVGIYQLKPLMRCETCKRVATEVDTRPLTWCVGSLSCLKCRDGDTSPFTLQMYTEQYEGEDFDQTTKQNVLEELLKMKYARKVVHPPVKQTRTETQMTQLCKKLNEEDKDKKPEEKQEKKPESNTIPSKDTLQIELGYRIAQVLTSPPPTTTSTVIVDTMTERKYPLSSPPPPQEMFDVRIRNKQAQEAELTRQLNKTDGFIKKEVLNTERQRKSDDAKEHHKDDDNAVNAWINHSIDKIGKSSRKTKGLKAYSPFQVAHPVEYTVGKHIYVNPFSLDVKDCEHAGIYWCHDIAVVLDYFLTHSRKKWPLQDQQDW